MVLPRNCRDEGMNTVDIIPILPYKDPKLWELGARV